MRNISENVGCCERKEQCEVVGAEVSRVTPPPFHLISLKGETSSHSIRGDFSQGERVFDAGGGWGGVGGYRSM